MCTLSRESSGHADVSAARTSDSPEKKLLSEGPVDALCSITAAPAASIYIHTYMHTCIPVHTSIYVHAYMHTGTYIHTYMHACIHTYIHTCTHTYRWRWQPARTAPEKHAQAHPSQMHQHATLLQQWQLQCGQPAQCELPQFERACVDCETARLTPMLAMPSRAQAQRRSSMISRLETMKIPLPTHDERSQTHAACAS